MMTSMSRISYQEAIKTPRESYETGTYYRTSNMILIDTNNIEMLRHSMKLCQRKTRNWKKTPVKLIIVVMDFFDQHKNEIKE